MLTPPMPQTSGKKTGITIGNFDGVHLGHQLLVRETLQICKERSLESIAITFWPHPRAFFSGHAMPPLADQQSRRRMLGNLGLNEVLELNFTLELAGLSPDEFVKSYLLPLNVDSLVIGYDFCLGKGRCGDFDALRKLGAQYGFSVTQVPPLLFGDLPISSTRLRQAINEGQVALAMSMLGRPYSVSGRVVHGQGRGTGLGFPTANLLPPETLLPPDGVYAAIVRHKGETCTAVTNIGFSPTFGGTQRTIESFLLDGSPMLYNEDIELLFLRRLRDEKKFPSVQELTAQIAHDVETARELGTAYLSRKTSGHAELAGLTGEPGQDASLP